MSLDLEPEATTAELDELEIDLRDSSGATPRRRRMVPTPPEHMVSNRPQVPGVVVRSDAEDLVDWIRGTVLLRLVLLVVATAVAFQYTIGSLLASLGADSPLAYLGLVPLLAMPVAFARARPSAGEPDVHDRHLDWIIGLPAVVIPIAALLVLPPQMSTFFWVWRIDVLLVPIFVAGVVSLLFGVRTLFRIRLVVAFLFLAWPVPARAALALGLDHFTSWTVTAVTKLTSVVPVATVVPNTDGAFHVPGPSGTFTVLVASACSGVNGLLGFLLVGGATLLVAKGRILRKAAWLIVGAAAVWTTNVIRILLVFAVGRFWGEDIAMNVFHPYVGLVTFAGAVLGMVLLLRRFGLSIGEPEATPRRTLGEAAGRAVPRIGRASVFLLVIVLVTAMLDNRLREVNPIASALGQPRIGAFQQDGKVDGFERARIDHFDWATRFFGDGSDWTRFQFSGGGTSKLGSQIPVIADVVTTSNLQTFDDYDVEACYRFHGYEIGGLQQVDLGHGQVATMLSWKDPNSTIRWLSVYWYLPVNVDGETRYQRIVLLVDSSSKGRLSAPSVAENSTTRIGIAINDQLNVREGAGPTSQRDAEFRRFLTGFAREIVASSAARSSDSE